MTGMLHALEKIEGVDIQLCFPIYDIERKKDGVCNGHRYYTFLCRSVEVYEVEMVQAFDQILMSCQPDIIHIWGTEYPHTLAMLTACQKRGVLKKVIINIQGLVSVCANHYITDIPEDYQMMKAEGHMSIREARKSFEQRGGYEIKSLKMVQHVIGRTDWDEACVKAINPQVNYHFCEEILRESFYRYVGKWTYENCDKHTIFVSQASYPVKGFHYLLNALKIIVREYPDTHVYVAGKNILNEERLDSYGNYIEHLIEKLELKKALSFVGKLDETEMVTQFLKANVFVSASIIENSPNSLAEAMLLGVPCVASYVGGVYNRMSFNEDGYLYPYNEPALLAFYICKVFENSNNLCDKFSSNSATNMKKLLDPHVNAIRNIEIYKRILENEESKNI